jgi:predicted dehydrogenase
MKRQNTRRHFLRTSAAASVGFWVASRDAWSQSRSPNERLRVACIGVGGKGESDATSVAGAGADVVAVCDVDDRRGKDTYERFPKARRFHDYRKLLDEMRDQVDAVMVSTPDHMHAGPTMMAMKLGKHVFTQKPLTHTVAEARLLNETARKQKIVSQMGNQGTAADVFRESVEIVRAGVLGTVREVHVWTNRPSWPQGAGALIGNRSARSALRGEVQRPAVPATLQWDLWLGCAQPRPYDPIYVPFSWRGWRDFGTGALGDMACHLMNMPWHALRLEHPTSVEARTAPDLNEETYPSWSVVTYDFPARGDLPPVKLTWYDGGANRPEWAQRRLLELTRATKLPSSGFVCVGEKGSITTVGDTPGGYALVPESGFAGFKPPDRTLPRVPGHYHEWVRACQENKPDMPMSNFAVAGPLTESILLGCVAMYAGKRLEWDAPQMKITNVGSANALLTKEYRKGWEL